MNFGLLTLIATAAYAKFCPGCGIHLEYDPDDVLEEHGHSFVVWMAMKDEVDIALATGILEREGIEYIVDTGGSDSMFPSMLTRKQILVQRSDVDRASRIYNAELRGMGVDLDAPPAGTQIAGSRGTSAIKLTLFERNELRHILRERVKLRPTETTDDITSHLDAILARLERDSVLHLADDELTVLKTFVEESLQHASEHSAIRQIADKLGFPSSSHT
jgi:hypothetical protein